MPPATVENNPIPNQKRAPSRRLIVICGLVILALIIGGIYWYNHNHGRSVTSSYSYRYDKSTYYVLSGKGLGYGIAVDRPDAISKVLSGIKNDASSVVFGQSIGSTVNGQAPVHIAYVAVKTRAYPKPEVLGTTTYRDTIAKTLNDSSSDHYSDTIINTQQFANQISIYKQKVTLSKAKPFTNSHIKNYAWQFNISTTDINSQNPPQQGKVLYILGNNGWYYTLITAEKNNWQNNSAFFQKVLDSVKVDQ